MLRQRAISAAVLVPPLVVVLVARRRRGSSRSSSSRRPSPRSRSSGCCDPPATRPCRRSGSSWRSGSSSTPRRPVELEGSGLILVAIGVILAAVGAFAKRDPRDGLPTWFATVFGALYASLLAFVVRLGQAAPEPPAGAPLAALGGERGWILLLILGVWAYDTGAYFIGRRFGHRKFLTHISPSKTYAGLVGGLVACTVVVTAIAVGLGEPPMIGLAARAAARRRGPGRRPGRVDAQAGGRREGLRAR